MQYRVTVFAWVLSLLVHYWYSSTLLLLLRCIKPNKWSNDPARKESSYRRRVDGCWLIHRRKNEMVIFCSQKHKRHHAQRLTPLDFTIYVLLWWSIFCQLSITLFSVDFRCCVDVARVAQISSIYFLKIICVVLWCNLI